MSFEIDWIQEHPTKKIAQQIIDQIEACLIETGSSTGVEVGEFSVMFVDQQRIQEINCDYRNIDRPTDVISFALNDETDEDDDFDHAAYYLGDIIICIDIAEQQAIEYEHSFEREICFLAIHGLLHLLGYDHQDEQQEQEMFGLQELIMKKRGLI